MPTAEDAVIYYEHSQSLVSMVELTDQGDNMTFKSADSLWSKKSGKTPDVKPNGLATGGAVTPGTANNTVDVAALTCYLAGVLTEVGASAGETITRSTDPETHIINSVTVTSLGAIAIVTGTEHASAFNESRGTAGGPPYIPVGDIEIAQVRTTGFTAAVVTSDEIFNIPGEHTEWYNNPAWEEERVDVENGIIGNAGIVFSSALPDSHTGDLPKKVYAEYYTPNFVAVPIASDFVPPEQTHSVSSTSVYRKTLAAKTSTLGQGSFTAYLDTGIDDNLLSLADEILWFKFKQDILESIYILCQGYLGISRTFPAADNITASCTISPLNSTDTVNVLG
jgi:hypothetical protein